MKFSFSKAQLITAYNNATEEQRESAKQEAIKAGFLHVDADGAMMEAKNVIVLIIAVFILASLLPPAITALNGANTTGWTATQLAIWGIVAVVIIATVVMKVAE